MIPVDKLYNFKKKIQPSDARRELSKAYADNPEFKGKSVELPEELKTGLEKLNEELAKQVTSSKKSRKEEKEDLDHEWEFDNDDENDLARVEGGEMASEPDSSEEDKGKK
jgi:hypothetical protein